MIEMGVRDDDGIERPAGERRQIRQSAFPFFLGVHPAVEHQPLPV